jgi:hypothetical protein
MVDAVYDCARNALGVTDHAIDAVYAQALALGDDDSVAGFHGIVLDATASADPGLRTDIVDVRFAAAGGPLNLTAAFCWKEQLCWLAAWVLPGHDSPGPSVLALLAELCRPRGRLTLYSPVLFGCAPIRDFGARTQSDAEGLSRLIGRLLPEIDAVKLMTQALFAPMTAWSRARTLPAIETAWAGYHDHSSFEEKYRRLVTVSAAIVYAPGDVVDHVRSMPAGAGITATPRC